jgi:Lon-like ATP-dependent protease
MLLEMEVTAYPANHRKGELYVTGIVEEEESGHGGKKIRRKSMARSPGECVDSPARELKNEPRHYDIHVNFRRIPWMAVGRNCHGHGVYSAIKN